MHSSYRFKADELNNDFLSGLKATFKGKEISVDVYDDGEVDATAFILSNPRYADELLSRMNDLKSGQETVSLHLPSSGSTDQ